MENEIKIINEKLDLILSKMIVRLPPPVEKTKLLPPVIKTEFIISPVLNGPINE